MAYLGPYVRLERIASARSNGFGYKAVVIHRKHTEDGRHFDRTEVVSRTKKTREEAVAIAQRRIGFFGAKK